MAWTCADRVIPKKLKIACKTVKCPNCGFEFSPIYARAISCSGCALAINSCEYIRCPRCDSEFKMYEVNPALNYKSARFMSEYLSGILSQYYADFGESPKR